VLLLTRNPMKDFYPEEHGDEGSLYTSDKDAYPERAQRVEGPLLPPRFGVPAPRRSDVETCQPSDVRSHSGMLPTLRRPDSATFRPSDVPTSHIPKPLLLSSLPTENCALSTAAPVDIQRVAGHNFPSAPSATVALIIEEGE
jgi:hypothetical protein